MWRAKRKLINRQADVGRGAANLLLPRGFVSIVANSADATALVTWAPGHVHTNSPRLPLALLDALVQAGAVERINPVDGYGVFRESRPLDEAEPRDEIDGARRVFAEYLTA